MGVEEFNFSECNENQYLMQLFQIYAYNENREIGAITFKYIHIIVG